MKILDLDYILELPDGSITDVETIRQIALVSTNQHKYHKVDKELAFKLNRKIDQTFSYAALYPNIMESFDIIAEMKLKKL